MQCALRCISPRQESDWLWSETLADRDADNPVCELKNAHALQARLPASRKRALSWPIRLLPA